MSETAIGYVVMFLFGYILGGWVETLLHHRKDRR